MKRKLDGKMCLTPITSRRRYGAGLPAAYRAGRGHYGSIAAETAARITVYRKIATLRQPDAFVAWLYGIARHKVYHAIRRPAHVQLTEDCEIADQEDHDGSIDRYDDAQIHQALQLLQPEHREVLILRFFERMPYSDIAEAVRCPVGTVRSRLNIAKKRLREHLERTASNERYRT
jgi:RNA polymerase sigma-70 factor (ECF subfamily)